MSRLLLQSNLLTFFERLLVSECFVKVGYSQAVHSLATYFNFSWSFSRKLPTVWLMPVLDLAQFNKVSTKKVGNFPANIHTKGSGYSLVINF